METRKFGNTSVDPSLLGFGCMRFPTLSDGSIDEVMAEKMLDTAIEKGVTYIDTAYPYHQGKSEPFVGKVLKKYPREKLLYTTKLPVWEVKSEEDVHRLFKLQLERLQTDYVDFYLLHALDQEKWDDILKYNMIPILMDYKKQGKIRNLGFSFHDEYPVFETIIRAHAWDFCQIQLNYMDVNHQAGLKGYRLAEELNIPIVIMEPIKGGSLANLPEEFSKFLKAYDPERTLSSWALRWVAQLPNVKVILSGMSTMEHVMDNLNTFNQYTPLNETEMGLIKQVGDSLRSRMKNGCTGCEYCMPCPHGVNIPRNFRIWNDYGVYGNKDVTQRRFFKDMDWAERADQCVACGNCEPLCPQAITIIQDLIRVTQEMEALK